MAAASWVAVATEKWITILFYQKIPITISHHFVSGRRNEGDTKSILSWYVRGY